MKVRIGILFACSLLLGCSAPVSETKLEYAQKLDRELRKSVNDALPDILARCEYAGPLGKHEVREKFMLWGRATDRRPSDPEWYYYSYESYEKPRQLLLPEDKDKPTTLVLLTEDQQGSVSGISIVQGITLTTYNWEFRICVIDWPEKTVKGQFSYNRSAPRMTTYESVHSAYIRELIDHISEWPLQDSNTKANPGTP